MVAGTNFLDQAFSSVLVPVWVRDHGFGAETVGLIFAVMAAASVLGALLATAFGPRLPRLVIYTVSFALCGLPRFGVLALDAPMVGVLVVMAVAGFSSGFVNPILGAVMFERIPSRLVGRVSSLINSLCWSLIPLGGLAGGLVVSGVGLSPTLLGFGVAYLALTLLPVAVPTFREMNRPASTARVEQPVTDRS
jgi:MFS family permease